MVAMMMVMFLFFCVVFHQAFPRKYQQWWMNEWMNGKVKLTEFHLPSIKVVAVFVVLLIAIDNLVDWSSIDNEKILHKNDLVGWLFLQRTLLITTLL